MTEGRDTLTGFRTRRGDLLGVHNAKTIKGESLGVLTAIMYLAPHELSGWNVCPMASADCVRDCLFTSGRGAMQKIKDARLARTRRFFEARGAFMHQLSTEISVLEAVAERHKMRLAVRLNGTSDILWERTPAPSAIQRAKNNLMDQFPRVQFYDYTKHTPAKRRLLPANYALTFSAQHETHTTALEALASGWNIAAVVMPETHAALMALGDKARVRFHDASAHDVRFLDPAYSVGLLLPKGSLRKQTPQTSGMILTECAALELGRAAHNAAQATLRGAA
jgi:hypothetical protein